MIGIINYGMGNLASIENALRYLQLPCEVFSDPAAASKYDRLILPGVGAFGAAMANLRQAGFTDKLEQVRASGSTPLLGICLGMQLLFSSSAEHGTHAGLGFIRGDVAFLGDSAQGLPVPHVGWNDLAVSEGSRLLRGLPQGVCFYFVHSYHCRPAEAAVVSATAEYGTRFAAVVEQGSILGCQFHPEKSQGAGLTLLRNFGSLTC